VTTSRTVDVAVSFLLLAFAALLAFDNWRTAWVDSTGPQAGYFPFYLSVILGGPVSGHRQGVSSRERQRPKPSSRATSCAACCRYSSRLFCSVS